jgi:hypothetical protein
MTAFDLLIERHRLDAFKLACRIVGTRLKLKTYPGSSAASVPRIEVFTGTGSVWSVVVWHRWTSGMTEAYLTNFCWLI